MRFWPAVPWLLAASLLACSEAEVSGDANGGEAAPRAREAPAAELAADDVLPADDTEIETCVPGSGAADRIFEGRRVMFGNLHAHSHLSDDISPFDASLSPARAYAYACSHGIDFLALTDHQKATDTAPHRLSMTQTEYEEQLFDVAMDFNAAHPGFVAIPGIEWGTTMTGNHVNVFGSETLPPDTILNGHYDALFSWAAENAEFLQLNHPNSWRRDSDRPDQVGNFGADLFDDDDSFVAGLGPAARTISIICTVRGGHLSGEHRHSEDKTHRDMQWENHYKSMLNRGFQLAPAASQDTHTANWGTVTAARTAVWVDGTSYDEVMEAFRARRVYATEDDELAVVFQVVHGGETRWMGDTVLLPGEEADVVARVRVWQVAGSDGDPTDEGPYTVQIMSDFDGQGGRTAAEWTSRSVPSGTTVDVPLHVVSGEYLYVAVTEENGQDNPVGDGEDIFDGSADVPEPDGERDDLNDSAWTAPIWFAADPTSPVIAGAPEALVTSDPLAGGIGPFVWTRASRLYHDPDCWVVALQGRGALRSGAAPAGKTRHDCRPAEEPSGPAVASDPPTPDGGNTP